MCGGGEGGRWVCLHLPSGSVGQPQQCEQHCPRPLHYVIAIENSTPVVATSIWCESVGQALEMVFKGTQTLH